MFCVDISINVMLCYVMKDGIIKCDGIIRKAMKKYQNKAWNFAEHYYNAPFLYIMSSGAAYAQCYGFAICSLQEMQCMKLLMQQNVDLMELIMHV